LTSLYPRAREDNKIPMTSKASGLLFAGSQAVMFGCIGLLQVLPGPFFWPLLLGMHAGILVFAKVKRRLSDHCSAIARMTRATYVLMAMYLPILGYKLLGKLGLLYVHDPVLHGATLVLSILAALLVVRGVGAIRACADR
jgi:hypothetical protein